MRGEEGDRGHTGRSECRRSRTDWRREGKESITIVVGVWWWRFVLFVCF